MGRIIDYDEVMSTDGRTTLSDDDFFIIDGPSGAGKVRVKELAQALADKFPKNAASIGVGYGKSGIYRGASLGSGTSFAAASSASQRAAIAAGTFEGLFIGDYWTINNRIYRIADFNYWKRSGDSGFNTNHIVIVPDANFGNSVMNDTNTTAGAYVGSKMYTSSDSMLNAARNTISNDFGSYLASHKEYLPNAVDSSGAQSAGAWYSSTVELMNEPMVYGCFIHAKPTSGVGHLYTIDKAQLALFRLNPAMVNLRYSYWLRDVVSSTLFAYVDDYGLAFNFSASSTGLCVRPVFPVKGTA